MGKQFNVLAAQVRLIRSRVEGWGDSTSARCQQDARAYQDKYKALQWQAHQQHILCNEISQHAHRNSGQALRAAAPSLPDHVRLRIRRRKRAADRIRHMQSEPPKDWQPTAVSCGILAADSFTEPPCDWPDREAPQARLSPAAPRGATDLKSTLRADARDFVPGAGGDLADLDTDCSWGESPGLETEVTDGGHWPALLPALQATDLWEPTTVAITALQEQLRALGTQVAEACTRTAVVERQNDKHFVLYKAVFEGYLSNQTDEIEALVDARAEKLMRDMAEMQEAVSVNLKEAARAMAEDATQRLQEHKEAQLKLLQEMFLAVPSAESIAAQLKAMEGLMQDCLSKAVETSKEVTVQSKRYVDTVVAKVQRPATQEMEARLERKMLVNFREIRELLDHSRDEVCDFMSATREGILIEATTAIRSHLEDSGLRSDIRRLERGLAQLETQATEAADLSRVDAEIAKMKDGLKGLEALLQQLISRLSDVARASFSKIEEISDSVAMLAQAVSASRSGGGGGVSSSAGFLGSPLAGGAHRLPAGVPVEDDLSSVSSLGLGDQPDEPCEVCGGLRSMTRARRSCRCLEAPVLWSS